VIFSNTGGHEAGQEEAGSMILMQGLTERLVSLKEVQRTGTAADYLHTRRRGRKDEVW